MWNDTERNILTIVVSGKVHTLDPLPVLRRYREENRKMGGAIFADAVKEVLNGEETVALASTVLPMMGRVLDWKPFDPEAKEGYLEAEIINGFTQFLEWLIESKKKGENSQSSAGLAGDSGATPTTASIAVSSSAEASSKAEGPGITQPVAV
jgi:hypothetical protein